MSHFCRFTLIPVQTLSLFRPTACVAATADSVDLKACGVLANMAPAHTQYRRAELHRMFRRIRSARVALSLRRILMFCLAIDVTLVCGVDRSLYCGLPITMSSAVGYRSRVNLAAGSLEAYKKTVRVQDFRPRQRSKHTVHPLTPAELLWCLLYVARKSVVVAPRGCSNAVVVVVYQAGFGFKQLAKCCHIDGIIIMMLLLCSGTEPNPGPGDCVYKAL